MSARPNPVVAAQWFRRHYYVRVPVDAAEAARRAGLEVDYRPLRNLHASAVLLPLGRRYVILVNQRQSPSRRNFATAHEIGHWVMHRYMRLRGIPPYQKSRYEREANAFAAELLMPRRLVAEMRHYIGFSSLASHLGVSRQALRWRLREIDVCCTGR